MSLVGNIKASIENKKSVISAKFSSLKSNKSALNEKDKANFREEELEAMGNGK